MLSEEPPISTRCLTASEENSESICNRNVLNQHYIAIMHGSDWMNSLLAFGRNKLFDLRTCRRNRNDQVTVYKTTSGMSGPPIDDFCSISHSSTKVSTGRSKSLELRVIKPI